MIKRIEVRWTPAAFTEFQEAYHRIANYSPKSAAAFGEEVYAALQNLQEFPHMGKASQYDANIRRLIINHAASSYTLEYKIAQSSVVVAGIWHHSKSQPT